MRAHALMLTDIVQNLESDRDALMRTKAHMGYLTHASYRSLIDAANAIPGIVRKVPQTISPFLEAARLYEHCMPSKEVVDDIRKNCDNGEFLFDWQVTAFDTRHLLILLLV